jgi:hypothetical protein
MLVAVLGFASEAAAVLYDLNVANGSYNVAANWIDHSTSNSGVPGELDAGLVRNGGTLNITAADGDINTYIIRVGAGPQTDVGALEGVDPTPPPTYGGAGTLNWTGGNILGNVTNSIGPRLNVGQRDNATDTNYTGIVNHSGGKISLNTTTSFLVVGSSGTTPTPTSVYNLMPGGTIGVTAGSGNTNNGINVRNGTFNMTGGQIVSDDTPASPQSSQRAITLSTTSGALGSENVAYANFSGGTVYTYGGMRVGNSSNAKAYVTISGNADLHFRAVDVTLAANATNSYGQLDMSGGSLKVGEISESLFQERRLIVGDSGTGVFNLTGGTVNLQHSFVVGNNATSKGTFYQTGGTLTVRDIEMNRNTGAWDLATENATIIIDGPSAVFTQQNTTSVLDGQTTIGQRGKGRFEVRQGQANLQVVHASEQVTSRATLAVTGGKLTIQDGLMRNSVANDGVNDNTPNIILTGGELELTPPISAISWQTNMHLMGTDFDPKPGALLQTNVGSFPNKPANFSLNSGSVWDLNIASNTLLGGADWVDVPNSCNLATACDVAPGATFARTVLNGGLINIIPIGGYTPAVGDTVTIVRNLPGGVTLNSGAVSLSDPNWVLQTNAANTAIELKYAPSAGVLGDYNGNGKVDAADYVLWRNGGPLANEVDAPGTVNGADYSAWRARFGNTSGAGSGGAVPEPSAIVLVGLFASVSLASRRARCGKR